MLTIGLLLNIMVEFGEMWKSQAPKNLQYLRQILIDKPLPSACWRNSIHGGKRRKRHKARFQLWKSLQWMGMRRWQRNAIMMFRQGEAGHAKMARRGLRTQAGSWKWSPRQASSWESKSWSILRTRKLHWNWWRTCVTLIPEGELCPLWPCMQDSEKSLRSKDPWENSILVCGQVSCTGTLWRVQMFAFGAFRSSQARQEREHVPSPSRPSHGSEDIPQHSIAWMRTCKDSTFCPTHADTMSCCVAKRLNMWNPWSAHKQAMKKVAIWKRPASTACGCKPVRKQYLKKPAKK